MIEDTVRLYGIKDMSMVDGEGVRLVLFFSGCIHACKGCQSPHTWDYNNGVDWKLSDIYKYIYDRKQWIDGITLSGGDPLYQVNDLHKFLAGMKKYKGLEKINVWLYTGYLFVRIPWKIRRYCNVIIDGRYDKDLPPVKWRGSSNQRVWRRKPKGQFISYSE